MKKKYLLNKAFWICLSISLLLWFSIKLPKNYSHTIKFNINYTNIPKNKILKKDQLHHIKLNIKGTGFNLLGYTFSNKNYINFNLNEINYITPDKGYILPYNYINSISKQLSSDIDIINFQMDTLWVNLEDKTIKKIPISINTKLTFVKGYQLIKPIEKSIDTIIISGSKSDVEKILSLDIPMFKKDNISTSFQEEITIKLPLVKNVKFSSDKVILKGTVDKVTQGFYDINIKVVNVPKNTIIKTFPKTTRVHYNVTLSNYKNINLTDFEIILDYSKINTSVNYGTLKLSKQPKEIFNVSISPKQVEYLIQKQ